MVLTPKYRTEVRNRAATEATLLALCASPVPSGAFSVNCVYFDQNRSAELAAKLVRSMWAPSTMAVRAVKKLSGPFDAAGSLCLKRGPGGLRRARVTHEQGWAVTMREKFLAEAWMAFRWGLEARRVLTCSTG